MFILKNFIFCNAFSVFFFLISLKKFGNEELAKEFFLKENFS